MVLQTISRYDYAFRANGKNISTAQIAEVIGESVPPYLVEKICRMMVATSSTKSEELKEQGQIQLQLEIA
jgi:DNA (cytosine-5)-methyltransferase 1